MRYRVVTRVRYSETETETRYRDYVDVVSADSIEDAADSVPRPFEGMNATVISAVRVS